MSQNLQVALGIFGGLPATVTTLCCVPDGWNLLIALGIAIVAMRLIVRPFRLRPP